MYVTVLHLLRLFGIFTKTAAAFALLFLFTSMIPAFSEIVAFSAAFVIVTISSALITAVLLIASKALEPTVRA